MFGKLFKKKNPKHNVNGINQIRKVEANSYVFNDLKLKRVSEYQRLFSTPNDVNVEPLFRRHETFVSSKYTPLILKKIILF